MPGPGVTPGPREKWPRFVHHHMIDELLDPTYQSNRSSKVFVVSQYGIDLASAEAQPCQFGVGELAPATAAAATTEAAATAARSVRALPAILSSVALPNQRRQKHF